MLFWFLLALMTGAAIFAVLWPLSRRHSNPRSTSAADVAVYRDQLAEVANDRARDLIGEREAEAARIEIARRLISASSEEAGGKSPGNPGMRRRVAAIAALTGIPVVALLLYLTLGSPGLPGAPLSGRTISGAHPDVAMMFARIENHLAEQPNDGRGWELIAPLYLRLGRTAEAVKARQNALRLLGETAERQADLGEALVANANGVVTADARKAFDRAVALDSKEAKARFFLGLAAKQDGRKEEAEKIWRELAAGAPADAPYLSAVRAALEQLKETK
ncbi:MAG TPA: c-type cytochrome biogenesis protein CcmI [Xanthobacteraceae bacterium]|nr:c-type cytochrome biogenesis protein CcmI [Xanthobacteraceae bacterium]